MLNAPTPLEDKKNLSFAAKKLSLLTLFTLPEPPTPSSCLIFLHPPKTGGTNLVLYIDAYASQNPSFKACRFPVPRVPHRSPNLITSGWLGGLLSAMKALAEDNHICDDKNFISGHFPFGLHSLINKHARYITLLRNPIEHAISSVNFDYQRGYVSKQEALSYLFKTSIDNPQTRLLAGESSMAGECTQQTLALAKKNIEEHFLLAGITEDTNTFMQILATLQSWQPAALAKAQVTVDKIINKTPELENQLKSKHQFDFELYFWVKERWLAYKENFFSHAKPMPLSLQQKIMCIPSEFANTRQAIFLTEEEIDQNNKGVSDDMLVRITQHHTPLIQTSPLILNQFLNQGSFSIPANSDTSPANNEFLNQKRISP